MFTSGIISFFIYLLFSFDLTGQVANNEIFIFSITKHYFKISVLLVITIIFKYREITAEKLNKHFTLLVIFFFICLLKPSIYLLMPYLIFCLPVYDDLFIFSVNNKRGLDIDKLPGAKKIKTSIKAGFNEILEDIEGDEDRVKINKIQNFYSKQGCDPLYKIEILKAAISSVEKAKGMEEYSVSAIACLKQENFQDSIQSQQMTHKDFMGEPHKGWSATKTINSDDMPKIGGMIADKKLVCEFLKAKLEEQQKLVKS